jgi:predicted nucleic acid-binding Zn ribbon protein
VTGSASIPADQPHDRCIKCGRATPLGVSLCEHDNPANIKSPSTTQVHATILIGVLAGFVLLLLLFRFGSAGADVFTSSVAGWAPRADGSIEVVISVANTGPRAAGASCRIAADGVPDFRDFVFFSEPIPPGETRQFTRIVPAPANGVGLEGRRLAVSCT